MYVPTFGEIRPFLDRTARYSICFSETANYENYRFIRDVPEQYDSLFIYGIGLVDIEFFEHDELDDAPYDDPSGILDMAVRTSYRDNLVFRNAIELMLSQEPRSE